jgi:ribulose 1,5-bisphosphate synthetase/thiazole synthase
MERNQKINIITSGAGPAGLTAAYEACKQWDGTAFIDIITRTTRC